MTDMHTMGAGAGAGACGGSHNYGSGSGSGGDMGDMGSTQGMGASDALNSSTAASGGAQNLNGSGGGSGDFSDALSSSGAPGSQLSQSAGEGGDNQQIMDLLMQLIKLLSSKMGDGEGEAGGGMGGGDGGMNGGGGDDGMKGGGSNGGGSACGCDDGGDTTSAPADNHPDTDKTPDTEHKQPEESEHKDEAAAEAPKDDGGGAAAAGLAVGGGLALGGLAAMALPLMMSPVAADLNGDGGIGTTGDSTAKNRLPGSDVNATVDFDLDGDGSKERIEWLSGDGDGMLVDNSDGRAATDMDGNRLFGDLGGQFKDGYEKLALRDADGDGQLTGKELEGLEFWVDDGDAQVQAGEMQSLAEHGVTSLDTNGRIVQNDRGEDLIQSSAGTVHGNDMLTEDVWFGVQRA